MSAWTWVITSISCILSKCSVGDLGTRSLLFQFNTKKFRAISSRITVWTYDGKSAKTWVESIHSTPFHWMPTARQTNLYRKRFGNDVLSGCTRSSCPEPYYMVHIGKTLGRHESFYIALLNLQGLLIAPQHQTAVIWAFI